jgi:hypothetical protein
MAPEQSGRTTANGIIDDPTDAAAVVCHGMDGGAVKLFVTLCTAQVTLHGWPDAAGHNKLCVILFFTEHAKHEETMHHDSTQNHAA